MVTAPLDPEFDAPPAPEPGVCITGRCDGSGWISVSDAYVDYWAGPPPSIPEWDPEFEAVHRFYRAKRAAFARSSYPCPGCQPALYDLWAGGHLSRWRHDAENCRVCRHNDYLTGKRRGGRGKRRQKDDEEERSTAPHEPAHTDRDAPPPEPPARLDLD